MLRRIAALLLIACILAAPAWAEEGIIQGDEYESQLEDALSTLESNAVETVTLSARSVTFLVGDGAQQLTATVLPEGADNARVYWMMDDESVATVDQNGLVTPRGVGTTTLTAETANGVLDTAQITVTDNPVTSISLNMSEYTMPACDSLMLLVEVGPSDADNKSVTWSSSDKSVAVVSESGKVFSKGVGECWISATADGGKDVVARCKITVTEQVSEPKYIALTFDDGPCANTMDILEILEVYDVKATFFMLGKLVDAHPEYALRVAQHGHELANHSYDHSKLTSLDMDGVRKQIEGTDAAIRKATGVTYDILCRAPGGSVTSKIYDTLNRIFVSWSVDTHDWKYRDPEYVYDYVARNAFNHAIVLMHDIRPTTMEALPKMIPSLLEQGYTLVTVSELIEITGLDNGKLLYAP